MDITINDLAPSPWWPCPECGGVALRAIVHFERGRWVDEGTYVALDPPDGVVGSVQASDVTCDGCGHRFDIHAHYGWPTPGDRYESSP